MKQKRSQEYTKDLDKNKKQELEVLLQKEGGKSKFRAKIQMTWIYVLASGVMLICLLMTNYLVFKQDPAPYVAIIVCTMVAIGLYTLYFWRWIKDFNQIKEYVQKHWWNYYIWVVALSACAFLISFICSLVVLCNIHYLEKVFANQFANGQFTFFVSTIVGIVLLLSLSIAAISLDTYILWHLEIDLQKLIQEYDENQIDYLREKIRQEAENAKKEQLNLATNTPTANLDMNIPKEQRQLTQKEIDEILKKNSSLNSGLEDDDKTNSQ